MQTRDVFVEGATGSFLFPENLRNGDPRFSVRLPENPVGRRAVAYRFAYNGLDVADTRLYAVHATQQVMDAFYDKFFASTPERAYKPEPPPVVTRVEMTSEQVAKFNPTACIRTQEPTATFMGSIRAAGNCFLPA